MTTSFISRRTLLQASPAATYLPGTLALAQQWPAKPSAWSSRSAGRSSDVLARAQTDKLSQVLGRRSSSSKPGAGALGAGYGQVRRTATRC
jgi:hypothetical protein